MYGAIILLHFLMKAGLCVVLAGTRFLQYRVVRIETAKWVGATIVEVFLLGILFTIIESRMIMYISALMVISTTVIVDYAIAEQMGWEDEKKNSRLALAQISYLVEVGALILAYRNGYWGETELIVLQKLAHLFGG
jgi:hypothetical protein